MHDQWLKFRLLQSLLIVWTESLLLKLPCLTEGVEPDSKEPAIGLQGLDLVEEDWRRDLAYDVLPKEHLHNVVVGILYKNLACSVEEPTLAKQYGPPVYRESDVR